MRIEKAIVYVIASKNGSFVIGNMHNAAHAVGLGASRSHRAKQVFRSERGKALLAEWGLDEDYEGIGHVALGYAAVEPKPAKPRKMGYVRLVE